jgi:hypothetical protein
LHCDASGARSGHAARTARYRAGLGDAGAAGAEIREEFRRVTEMVKRADLTK